MNNKTDKRKGTVPDMTPSLSSFWTVGFTGHRELASPNIVPQRIAEVLGEIASRVSGRLVALSSVARGADVLFVEQALGAGLPWLAILPMPAQCFFNEADFPNEGERALAESFLPRSLTVEICATPVSEDEAMNAEWRESAFDDAGFRIVDDADILIAVLRCGDPGRGPGGTADVVRYAASRKRPSVLIDPDTGEVEWRDFPERICDPLMAELLGLRKARFSGSVPAEKAGDVIWQQFTEFFSAVDAAALRKVPLVRNATGVAVILHTAAMIVASFALTLLASGVVGHGNSSLLAYATWIKASLVAVGFITLVWITFFKPQATAARYRLAAEFCRSVLATWDFPRPLSGLYRTPLKEFRHFCRSLLIFRLVTQASSSNAGTPSVARRKDMAGFRSAYLSKRIQQQLAYYRKKLHRAPQSANNGSGSDASMDFRLRCPETSSPELNFKRIEFTARFKSGARASLFVVNSFDS